MLGVLEDLDAQSTRWKVADGSMLVLYTDGLIERRGEVLTEGLDRLKKAVHDDFPERLCAQLMDSMIGDYVPADDVAVLVLRIRTPERAAPTVGPTAPEVLVTRSELFDCAPDSAKAARRFIAECVEQLGLSSVPTVQLMVSELATNAVVHAGSLFDVTVERLSDQAVRVEVRDFGDGIPRLFNRGVEAEGGRGLQIVNLLAETWGVDTRLGGRGKSTWFTVKIGADGSAHR
jgi:anti-sigma regulatory factor (Ser/Thr protein kinase)